MGTEDKSSYLSALGWTTRPCRGLCCLLTEEEMHLGPEVWESTFKFEDKIKLRSEEEISTGYRVEITELSDDSDN